MSDKKPELISETLPCGHPIGAFHNFGAMTHKPTGVVLPETWVCAICQVYRMAPDAGERDSAERGAPMSEVQLALENAAYLAEELADSIRDVDDAQAAHYEQLADDIRNRRFHPDRSAKILAAAPSPPQPVSERVPPLVRRDDPRTGEPLYHPAPMPSGEVRGALEAALAVGYAYGNGGWFTPNEDIRKAIVSAIAPTVSRLIGEARLAEAEYLEKWAYEHGFHEVEVCDGACERHDRLRALRLAPVSGTQTNKS
jgi:hypothetical protein